MHFVCYYCNIYNKNTRFDKPWSIALQILWPRRQKGWMVNTRPRPLYPRERSDTHCIGGWVGYWVGLDRWGISRPIGIRYSERPSRSKPLHRLPKERDLAAVSCFVAGTDWYRAVGANIRFVVLCFLLLVTTNLRAAVLWVELNGVMPIVAGRGLSVLI